MKMNWDDLRLFLEVARTGGLSNAAAKTGKSPATLGRRLLELEKATGLELVERHARGYHLKEDGLKLLEQAEEIERSVLRISKPSQESGTLVKISAGSWMSRFLAQNVDRLASPGEGIRLRFLSAEQKVDFSRRQAVIGLRNKRPTESALACQKVASVRFAVYAARPDISGWIGVDVETPSADWVRKRYKSDITVESNTPRLALDLALAGAGKIVLPELIGDAEKSLIRISGAIDELTHEQWLVSHHEERHEPSVRTVLKRIRILLRA
jgi:DNA-binding transcriptional LysR family regulator